MAGRRAFEVHIRLVLSLTHGRGNHMNQEAESTEREIVRRIVKTSQPDKVILFGSRARGGARAESDYDILVIKDSQEPRYRRSVPLYVALTGLLANVDVMVYTPAEVEEWKTVPQAFITTAMREGRVVYERPR
jgi:uncharacterized protein